MRVTDFFIEKGDKAYKIKYKGNPLITISKKGLKDILTDNLDLNFFGVSHMSALEQIDVTGDPERDVRLKALKLVQVYEEYKQDFYCSKKIEFKVGPKDNSFKFFIKAVMIMERHDVNNRVFMESQIAGLKFVAQGRGTFPSPSQIASDNAEDRLLRFLVDNNKKEFQKIPISSEDLDIPLDENARFRALSQKVKNEIATLKEALYVRELLWIKKKKRYKKVESYIGKIENGK